MRGVDLAFGKEMREMRIEHFEIVGEGLQLAIAALFAAGAEMVALDEQHLQQNAAAAVQLRRVALDFLARHGLGGAGRKVAAIDDHRAELARAVRRKLRMGAEMRDIDARGERRRQDGLAWLKAYLFAVDGQLVGDFRHASAPRCAEESSRPAISRAVSSAASRSKPARNPWSIRRGSKTGANLCIMSCTRAGRGLAEAAMAGRAHNLVQPRQFVEFVSRAMAGGDLFDDAGDKGGSDAAGRAEAAAIHARRIARNCARRRTGRGSCRKP